MIAETFVEHRLEFARLPSHWQALVAVAALAVLLYVTFWLYRRETRMGVSRRMRLMMGSLRSAVIGLLALIWLEPILATYIHRTIQSYVLVLVDGSASMQLADRYRNPSQAKAVHALLDRADIGAAANADVPRHEVIDAVLQADNEAWLHALAQRNAVQLWRFGDAPSRVGMLAHGATAAETLPLGEPTPAPMTDLGSTLRQAVRELGVSPIAGIVVLGDGGINAGESADVIGRFAQSRNIPLYAVGIGDPHPPQNIRIAEVVAPDSVFVGDPFTITANVAADGLVGETVSVALVDTSGDVEQIVSRQTVPIDRDSSVADVKFTVQADRPREVAYVVRAEPAAGESVLDDNERPVAVRILDNKMRVLLIAGSPQWDYRFLLRLLERDASVDVSTWLQSADPDAVREGTTVITQFPRRADELFAYDVIVLFDPQPQDFDSAWGDAVQSAVGSNGAGLLYVAGRKYTSRFMNDPDCASIVDMLPIVVDPDAELIINQLGHFQSQGWPPYVDPAVQEHPVLALADDAATSAAIWKQLTSVYWHYPVRREKPLATVLLRHSDPRMRNAYGAHVLLATQFFGSGRTGFLGFDSTWRWRRYGERYFDRFWVQLLRHLMEGRLGRGESGGVLLSDRDTVSVGEAVLVTARLMNADHLPLEQSSVTASVEMPDGSGTSITLDAEPSRPGWYRGRFVPRQAGRITVRLQPPSTAARTDKPLQTTVHVTQPNLEMQRPQLDVDKLTTLATRSAGGRYVPLEKLDTIPESIEDRNATLVVSGAPIVLWDRYRWIAFALLIGLLTVEWILRKRARLL